MWKSRRQNWDVKEEFSMGIKVVMTINYLNMSEYIFQHQYSHMVNYMLQFQE